MSENYIVPGKRSKLTHRKRDGSVEVTYYIDGKEASPEDYYADRARHGQAPGGHHQACWPMTACMEGINPDSVPAKMEELRAKGCPTEFTRDGSPILTSPAHYKAYCRAEGLYHRNAGYSDADPINYSSDSRPSPIDLSFLMDEI